jgi:5-dehydro-2-deoxygluconokinase
MGRVGADLYPLQLETPLDRVRTFERFVGGFAGNVSTGLARLGVRTAIVSAVGDDGHGRFVREFLAAEGVDIGWLGTHPTLRTALAFCEMWPPDRFPITFYRFPTCPDWELTEADLPRDLLPSAPLAYVTGTGFAREPSRTATMAALGLRERSTGTTVLDLDWRADLWSDRRDYVSAIGQALGLADTIIGGRSEFEAAELHPDQVVERGPRLVVVKRGPDGVTVIDASGRHEVAGLQVPVVNGLGAGDAFAAAFGSALLEGRSPFEAAARGNAAGAIVAARLSCSTAMPRTWELERLLDGGRVVDGEVLPAGSRRATPRQDRPEP